MKQITNKNKFMLAIEDKFDNCSIEELLRKWYVDDNLSTTQISRKYSIAYKTVFRWLLLAGIYSHRLKSLT